MHPGFPIGQVFLYRSPVDFRKSIDGLAALVEMELEMNVFSGALFLFINRGRDKSKLLYWSRNGSCLWYKRLERERFAWMAGGGSPSCEISIEELRWLLEGVDIWASIPH
jgi:transposase